MIFCVVEVWIMTLEKVSPKELDEKLQGNEQVILLDVRAEEKYNDFHIKNPNLQSVNIPKTIIFELEEKGMADALNKLPKDREVVVTCTTGNSAAKCAGILDGLGYQVKLLDGGITAWKEYRK
jgi:rhodanese-related sulfurtransferase